MGLEIRGEKSGGSEPEYENQTVADAGSRNRNVRQLEIRFAVRRWRLKKRSNRKRSQPPWIKALLPFILSVFTHLANVHPLTAVGLVIMTIGLVLGR